MENERMNRRDFLKSIVKWSAGLAIFSMFPSMTNATTLTEFKEGKRFNFDDTQIKADEYKFNDEAEIGEKILGLEGLMIREGNLKFKNALEYRSKTDGVVIHHVGGSGKNINSQTIHRWHLSNGWAGIGYHYIIRKDGTIERGRPLETIGAHCYSQNEHTIGICVVGNFELSKPTYEQCKATEQLIGAVCGMYGIIPNEETIVGHKYYNKTLCPGTYLQKWIPDIVKDAKKYC